MQKQIKADRWKIMHRKSNEQDKNRDKIYKIVW